MGKGPEYPHFGNASWAEALTLIREGYHEGEFAERVATPLEFAEAMQRDARNEYRFREGEDVEAIMAGTVLPQDPGRFVSALLQTVESLDFAPAGVRPTDYAENWRLYELLDGLMMKAHPVTARDRHVTNISLQPKFHGIAYESIYRRATTYHRRTGPAQ